MSIIHHFYITIDLLHLTGPNLDARVVQSVNDQLVSQISPKGTVLNMAGIEFADSAGLGLLLRITRSLPKGALVLTCVSKGLLSTFQRVPKDKLPLICDCEAAVKGKDFAA